MVRARRNARNLRELERREQTWLAIKGKEESLLVEIQRGVTIAAYTDSELCRLIYKGGFELEERQLVCKFLRRGDTFVDLGANIGLYTLAASKAVTLAGRVFAFEPCSGTYARLLENVERNRLTNIQCRRIAMSSSGGSLMMTISSDGFDAWNSAGRPTMGARFDDESVPCETWDSFVEQEGLRGAVQLVKVDIEGWEGHFLAGGAGELSRPDAPSMLIELNNVAAEAAGSSVDLLRHQLKALGYALYRIGSEGLSRQLGDCETISGSENVLAVKNLEMVLGRLAGGRSNWMR
jgi:FkbM family methyltransferase